MRVRLPARENARAFAASIRAPASFAAAPQQHSTSQYGELARRSVQARAAAEAPAQSRPTSEMQRNRLGTSDLVVSEACIGTMTFGRQNTEAEAHEQLACAADYGVNFIDTAEMYPICPAPETQGRTSQYVGSWLKAQRRDDWIVASKVAGRSDHMQWIPANRTSPRGEEAPTRVDGPSIRAAVEGELRRLQTDYIDLLQLHWPDRYTCSFGNNQYQVADERDAVSFAEQVEAVGELMRAGKVRHWGLSNETTFGLMSHCAAADAAGVQRPVSVQNCFNLIHRVAETELAEACSPSHLNIGILPWSPLCGGALSGKYLASATAPEKSRFALWPDRYKRYNTKRVRDATDKYVKIAGEAGCTPAQLAYAFCKTRWFVPSTIIGATSVEQLQENLDAFDLKLPEVILKAIDDVHIMHRNPALAN